MMHTAAVTPSFGEPDPAPAGSTHSETEFQANAGLAVDSQGGGGQGDAEDQLFSMEMIDVAIGQDELHAEADARRTILGQVLKGERMATLAHGQMAARSGAAKT